MIPSCDMRAGSHQALEQRLDYRFRQPELLRQALTHSSHSRPHNERLEFLGDSLLGAMVSLMLYHHYPDAREGTLSRMRVRLICGETLAEVAGELDLGQHLQLGQGERKSGGHQRASILADALEALLAAVCLDGGFEALRELVERLFAPRVEALPEPARLKDPKTRLQELLQSRGLSLPVYELVDEQGPDHARRFTVRCQLPEQGKAWCGDAGSRRKAEQRAARAALEDLLRA